MRNSMKGGRVERGFARLLVGCIPVDELELRELGDSYVNDGVVLHFV